MNVTLVVSVLIVLLTFLELNKEYITVESIICINIPTVGS